jgi:hypothetical protein
MILTTDEGKEMHSQASEAEDLLRSLEAEKTSLGGDEEEEEESVRDTQVISAVNKNRSYAVYGFCQLIKYYF